MFVPGAERLLGVGQVSAVVGVAPCGDFLVAAEDTATMLPEQVLAESIRRPPVALHQNGVAAYQLATFNVTLVPMIDETVTVTDVEVVEFERRPAQVAWAIGRPSECGGVLYERGYSAHLDSTPLTMESDEVHAMGESVGFTVSLDDPAELGIAIRGCEGMYEFGLEFHYRIRGTEGVVRVGTEDEPLRLLGGEPAHSPQIATSRNDVFEVTGDAAATLCQGGHWDAPAEPEGGEVAEEPGDIDPVDPEALTDHDAIAEGEYGGPIDPELADDSVIAEWEHACAKLESALSALEQTLFGCAEGEEEANAHDAACAKAETVLSPIEYGMLDCGDGDEEEANAHEAACAKAETVLSPIERGMLGCGEGDEVAAAYDAACAKAETVLSREQFALFCEGG